jgi:hypothetical protein
MHAFTRTLVAALAVLALAAPVASARIDPPPNRGSVHVAPAPSRGPVYVAPAPSRGSVYWSYDYQAQKPASHPAAPASAPATSDDDIPWLTIGFGVAGAFLLISAAAAAVAVSRRPRGAGIA